MIDTINFRLNNVDTYPTIKTQYERTSKQGETTVIIDEDTGEISENTKIRAIMHHDSNNLIPLSKRSKLYIASSHYSVSYFYNISQNFIDFNLSIPKYLYGTNILQFISYFDESSDAIYNKLVDFVTGFVRKHFVQEIDFKDLELTRLDLCFNQFFNSKFDALTYLNQQKQLLLKYARSSKNKGIDYQGESFLYTTKRYSFKIYHKGTEFNKHDKKELAKKNPTKERIPDLQDISDKILRYEVTFRKGQINYLFEKAELHDRYVKFLHNENARFSMRKLNPQLYNRAIEFVEQSKSFVFANVSQHDAINTQCVAFDRLIFKELYNFFWEYVKKFQLRQRLSLFDVVKQIDEKNNVRDQLKDKAMRAKNSYNKPMLVALAMLSQYTPIEDLKKSNLMPKTTFYRYKKQLKELGIESETTLTDMPPPSLDYIDYKHYFSKHHLK